jgi:hypothetical protein
VLVNVNEVRPASRKQTERREHEDDDEATHEPALSCALT